MESSNRMCINFTYRSSSYREYLSSMHFNMTANFRRDSDFFTPLVRTERRLKTPCPNCLPNSSTFNISEKHSILAWFVSHCKTHSRREKYFHKLSKYISTNKYGKCGQKAVCPFRGSDNSCTKETDVLKQHKFYFSAENAICKYYVTGKYGLKSIATQVKRKSLVQVKYLQNLTRIRGF